MENGLNISYRVAVVRFIIYVLTFLYPKQATVFLGLCAVPLADFGRGYPRKTETGKLFEWLAVRWLIHLVISLLLCFVNGWIVFGLMIVSTPFLGAMALGFKLEIGTSST